MFAILENCFNRMFHTLLFGGAVKTKHFTAPQTKGGFAMLNWNLLWLKWFGVTELWGINVGFWAALFAIGFVVIAMNLVFWTRPRFPASRS